MIHSSFEQSPLPLVYFASSVGSSRAELSMGSMKLTTMLVCVMVVAMAGLASRVQANYYVSDVVYEGEPGVFLACPSNYYNCSCFGQGRVRAGTVSPERPFARFFTVTNLCGYTTLDHYLNNDGTYTVFVAGGDGKVVATCRSPGNDGDFLFCPREKTGIITYDTVYDYLICSGQPCQPDR